MKNILAIITILFVFTSCKKEKQAVLVANNETKEIVFTKLDIAILAGGSLFRADSIPSEFIKPRPVDVWLPENYSKEKKYSVLYMHDGQNLFDSTTTWNKQEWKVDEWATKLMSEDRIKDVIVVGIHNISSIRWLDLLPEKAFYNIPEVKRDSLIAEAKRNNFEIKLSGDNYLKFIVEELKPIIDNQYSVLTDRENTFVAGSSMGGLMSMYAISEYPQVFGGAGCVSTHWVGYAPVPDNPFPEAFFKYMEDNIPDAKTHKLYFDYGTTTLDAHYGQYTPRLNSILESKGYTEATYKNIEFKGADHSENAWNKRLDKPLTFLLGKN